VFFDPNYAKASSVQRFEAIATYFAHRAYDRLDAAKLATFLQGKRALR
jgi:hypothetical protein